MNKEAFYQKFLENYLCGTHCKIQHGITDVSTDTIHAEIKEWCSWKSAFGQLLYYNHVIPKPDLRLYMFGTNKHRHVQDILDFLKHYNISLFELSYHDGVMSVYDYQNNYSNSIEWNECRDIVTSLTNQEKEEIRQIFHNVRNEQTKQTDLIIDLDMI